MRKSALLIIALMLWGCAPSLAPNGMSWTEFNLCGFNSPSPWGGSCHSTRFAAFTGSVSSSLCGLSIFEKLNILHVR